MKPLHHYTGHKTVDLTECKLHCVIEDGKRKIVALVPKTWEKDPPQKLMASNGQMLDLCFYSVTDFDEVVLFEDAVVK